MTFEKKVDKLTAITFNCGLGEVFSQVKTDYDRL